MSIRFVYRVGGDVQPGDLESFEVDGITPKGRDPGACPAVVCVARGALAAAHGEREDWTHEKTLRALRGEALEG